MPNRRSEDAMGRGGGRQSEPSGGESPGALPTPQGWPPPRLTDGAAIPWELPHTFLGLDEKASAWPSAMSLILPVPYESTTSWGGGTRAGPRAILEASRYVEL